MKRSRDLVAGWVVTTSSLVMMAAIIRPLMVPAVVVWVFVTLAVAVDLTRALRDRRRAVRELKAAIVNPGMNRVVVLPSPLPQVAPDMPSGMILLPPQDRDPRWSEAREHQRLQQSGELHVVRGLQPLTDCPAGHYDYHELRGSSLDRAVRRCAWCPPSANTWTEGPVGSKDSER